jgi:hypothetical protein
MSLRNLRILWTAFCGIATVLLIVMWVRSYTWRDDWAMELVTMRGISVESAVGQFAVRTFPTEDTFFGETNYQGWHQTLVSADPCWPANNSSGFDAYFSSGYGGVVVPHWLLTLGAATVATWLGVRRRAHFRFSLRSLLIATTIVAVALGLIAWLR